MMQMMVPGKQTAQQQNMVPMGQASQQKTTVPTRQIAEKQKKKQPIPQQLHEVSQRPNFLLMDSLNDTIIRELLDHTFLIYFSFESVQ